MTSCEHPTRVLDVAWACQWMRRAQAAVAAAKDELTELDRQIGDGDHGFNLDRGMAAVVAKVDEGAGDPAQEVGAVFKLVATTLMSTVGGAAGPLYGTAFLRASRVSARPQLTSMGLVSSFEAAVEGIEVRGHVTCGEKTMLDVWAPASQAAADALASNPQADVIAVLQQAVAAAHQGVVATVPMLATKGRASYLGDRSIGHVDPGARSSAIILQAALDAAVDILGECAVGDSTVVQGATGQGATGQGVTGEGVTAQ